MAFADGEGARGSLRLERVPGFVIGFIRATHVV